MWMKRDLESLGNRETRKSSLSTKIFGNRSYHQFFTYTFYVCIVTLAVFALFNANSWVFRRRHIKYVSKYKPNWCPANKDPCFLVIGIDRCGVETLRNWLEGHPQTQTHASSEGNYWREGAWETVLGNSLPQYKWGGIEAYVERFLPGHKYDTITYEVDASAIEVPPAPYIVQTFLPWVQVLVMLRNPIERCYSAFVHLFRVDATFRTSMYQQFTHHSTLHWLHDPDQHLKKKEHGLPENQLPNLFHLLMESEVDILKTALNGVKHKSKLSRKPRVATQLYLSGGLFPYNHSAPWPVIWREYICLASEKLPRCAAALEVYKPLLRSLYFFQLQHWINVMPRNQIKVILVEELWADRTRVLESLANFLKIDRKYESESTVVVTAPEMHPQTRKMLATFLRPQVVQLQALFPNMDFPLWWRDFRTKEWEQNHLEQMGKGKECVFDCEQ